MNFSKALELLKEGKRVVRRGSSIEYIVLMPALYMEAGTPNERTKKHIGEHTPLNSQPYFAMKDFYDSWQPGWLPSQADLMADDWCEVE